MTSGYEPRPRVKDHALGDQLAKKHQHTFKRPKHPRDLKGQKTLLPPAVDKPQPPPDEDEVD